MEKIKVKILGLSCGHRKDRNTAWLVQYALKNDGIGPEDTGADGAGSHLTLAPGDPVFTGGSLTIQLMNMPRSMGEIRHIAEELTLRHGKEHPFRLDSHQLSDRHEATRLLPSMTLVQKHNGFVFPFSRCQDVHVNLKRVL